MQARGVAAIIHITSFDEEGTGSDEVWRIFDGTNVVRGMQ